MDDEKNEIAAASKKNARCPEGFQGSLGPFLLVRTSGVVAMGSLRGRKEVRYGACPFRAAAKKGGKMKKEGFFFSLRRRNRKHESEEQKENSLFSASSNRRFVSRERRKKGKEKKEKKL
jgi:hypothetical protein